MKVSDSHHVSVGNPPFTTYCDFYTWAREPAHNNCCVSLSKNSKFDTFCWALRWLSSGLQSLTTFYLSSAVRRHSDSDVTGHGASYFAIEFQGVNVDQISSSVMNVFVLKFLFMTDSIYLLLITTFLNPPPPAKKKTSNARTISNYTDSLQITFISSLLVLWSHCWFG
jgi:hypothetical protein